jgi:prepilin-type N-terminal cleavage/methylation domain-containing protein
LFHKNQLGFTLTELILAIAIAGIITGGITMTIFQVFSGSARTSNHMTAVRQVQNAGYWVSHDAQMAQQEPVIGDDPEVEFLTLTWKDWETSEVHLVTYTLLTDNKLQRSHSINDGTAETAIIAEYINNPDQTSCVWDGSVLTFTVTATVGEQTETRIYEIVPRPGS